MPVTEPSYERTCFVMMPYGRRSFRGKNIDFDRIYENVIKPAIRRVKIQGKPAIPLRADEDCSAHLLHAAMFQHLLRSRLGLAEMSTENGNVTYELSLRHALVSSGTVIAALRGAPIAFDIVDVYVTRYQHTPPAAAEKAITLIARSLRETVKANQVDSPTYAMAREMAARMGDAQNVTAIGALVLKAERAAYDGHKEQAAEAYREAAALEPQLAAIQQRMGMLLLDIGKTAEARTAFHNVLQLSPGNSVAEHLLSMTTISEDPLSGMLLRKSPEDKKLAVETLLANAPAPGRLNVSVTPWLWNDGRVHSTVRVIASPEVQMPDVPELLQPFGAVLQFGQITVPETGHTVSHFGVVSDPWGASGVTAMRNAFNGLPQIGKIEIKGPGSGFGGGGTGSGFGGIF